jgi:hypothetical protein
MSSAVFGVCPDTVALRGGLEALRSAGFRNELWLAIPGIGPLIAAGPIVALLAGAGAIGAAG